MDVDELSQKRVHDDHMDGGRWWWIAPTPGWRNNPPHEDTWPRPGVHEDSSEAHDAGRAIVRRFRRELREYVPPAVTPPSLREWIAKERAARERRYGRGQGYWHLAADLLGIQAPAPAARTNAFKALKRALERAGEATKEGRKEAHGKLTNPEYIRLVRDYGGEDNPYTAPKAPTLADTLAEIRLWITVRADMTISKREYEFEAKTIGPEPGDSEDIAYLLSHPSQFVAWWAAMLSQIVGMGIAIGAIYSLSIRMDPGKLKRRQVS